MSIIPTFPEFKELSLEMREELHPHLSQLKIGISEFTFANLFLFRTTYNYGISKLPDGNYAISGNKNGEKFIMLPKGVPDFGILCELFKTHCYIKNVCEPCIEKNRIELERQGFCIVEDRDNFDYLYSKKDLATLSGKKFHKKRNLVNQFISNYSYKINPLKSEFLSDALAILEEWNKDRQGYTDYTASKEAIQKYDVLGLKGSILYVDDKPVGYTQGEPIGKCKGFAIHFEKAVNGYKGIYQFINKTFAESLPNKYSFINREQDLGDLGLRQAKMTYRPIDFVKKYRVYMEPCAPCP